MQQHFKPEFLNRVDDIIIFRPLGQAEIEHIVDLQLVRFERMLGERKLALEVTPEARRMLAEEGYDPAFGARPLKRAILKAIQDPLAEELLAAGYPNGSTVRVDVEGEGFKFVKA